MQKRIYTDPRFPGVSIENHGTCRFYVIADGKTIGEFIGKENVTSQTVSDDFAQRRAEDYFERWASFKLNDEWAAQNFGNARFKQPTQIRKTTPQEVERAMSDARAATDPEHKQALQKRALSYMQREESTAEQVVAHLLYER